MGSEHGEQSRIMTVSSEPLGVAPSSRIRRVWNFLTEIPAEVPEPLRRYYIYWKFFYAAAGVEHLLMLTIFMRGGVRAMVIFNEYSIVVFITALLLLKLGRYRTAYWLAISELILHGIAATLCVGPQYGFTSYTFLVVVLAYVQPFYSWRVSLVLAAVTLASASLVTGYGLFHPPIYEVSERWTRAMIIRQVVIWPVAVLAMMLPFMRASQAAERKLVAAFGESNRLLLNILPQSIATRLTAGQEMIADERSDVSVLFVDIVGFVSLSGRLQPAELVALLNGIFNAIDQLVEKHGLEKIKTIGDAYMAAAGLPDPIDEPEVRISRLALDIIAVMPRFTLPGSGERVQVRIGISSGRVVAGVIGKRKFAYDLWGDAVNVAARMEATSLPGMIHVTDDFAARLSDRFVFGECRTVEVKGKGPMQTRFLLGERGEAEVVEATTG